MLLFDFDDASSILFQPATPSMHTSVVNLPIGESYMNDFGISVTVANGKELILSNELRSRFDNYFKKE